MCSKIRIHSPAICVTPLLLKIPLKEKNLKRRKKKVKRKSILVCQKWGSDPGGCPRLNRKSHYKSNPELECQLTAVTAGAFTLCSAGRPPDWRKCLAVGCKAAPTALGVFSRPSLSFNPTACCWAVTVVCSGVSLGLSWFLFRVLENCISLGCWLQWFVFLLVWNVQDMQRGCFRCSRRVCRKNSSCPGELQCKSSPCKGTVSVHWNIYLIFRLRVFHILNWCQRLWPKQYLELVALEEGCVLQQIWEM